MVETEIKYTVASSSKYESIAGKTHINPDEIYVHKKVEDGVKVEELNQSRGEGMYRTISESTLESLISEGAIKQ